MQSSRLAWFRAARRLCWFLVVAATVALSNSQAWAQEPSSAEIAVARRLFREASAFGEQGRWEEAAQALREAIAIKETPGLRFHLANAEAKQGHLVEAMVEFDRADELLGTGVKAPDVASLLGPARDELRARVPSVHLVGLVSTRDAELTIDARVVVQALLDKPIPLNPGKHKLIVRSPGYQPAIFDVELKEGERRELKVELIAERPPEPPRAPASKVEVASDLVLEPSSAPSARTVVLVSEVVLTVASLGAGTAYAFQQRSSDDRVAQLAEDLVLTTGSQSPCTGEPAANIAARCQQLREEVVKRREAGNRAVLGFAGASVGAVATIATALLWSSPDGQASGRLPGVLQADVRFDLHGGSGWFASVSAQF